MLQRLPCRTRGRRHSVRAGPIGPRLWQRKPKSPMQKYFIILTISWFPSVEPSESEGVRESCLVLQNEYVNELTVGLVQDTAGFARTWRDSISTQNQEFGSLELLHQQRWHQAWSWGQCQWSNDLRHSWGTAAVILRVCVVVTKTIILFNILVGASQVFTLHILRLRKRKNVVQDTTQNASKWYDHIILGLVQATHVYEHHIM